MGRPQHNWAGEQLEAPSGEGRACSCFLISGRGMELADSGCFEQLCGFVVIQCNIIWESSWIPDVEILFPGWDVLWKQRALLQNSKGNLPCIGKTGEQTLIRDSFTPHADGWQLMETERLDVMWKTTKSCGVGGNPGASDWLWNNFEWVEWMSWLTVSSAVPSSYRKPNWSTELINIDIP